MAFVVNTVALGQGVSEATLLVFCRVSYSTGAASPSRRCAVGVTSRHDKETSALRSDRTPDLSHSYNPDYIVAFIRVHFDDDDDDDDDDNNNNNNNNNKLQLGCHPVAVVILHVYKI